MKSIISYPDRGSWGRREWRGNCSGYLIKDIILQFKPSYFVDVCEGSGTSGDVCREMGIEYTGLDLNQGFDFTFDYVLSNIKRPADIVFSHPPYSDMIKYSDNIRDTSRCFSIEEFLEKSQMMLLNQREATRENGFYMTLIGDQKANGVCRSYQADFIGMMPKKELVNICIKTQHNCMSDSVNYSGSFIPIVHEYLIIWKRKFESLWNICFDIADAYKSKIASTWRNSIRIVFSKFNGKATLSQIYEEIEKVAAHLIRNNTNWKAKIRQVLQRHFLSVERGVWSAI